MGNLSSKDSGPFIRDLGNGFYNIRGHFKIIKGLVDIGTHMSLVRLPSGKFLVIDTIPLSDNPALKQEFDTLTENGRLIEAVVATHPFHTMAFPGFHALYPSAMYYGTPRHVRTQPQIPWAGDVTKSDVQAKWQPEVSIRIPTGAEFVAPQPELYNHFSSAWVFHAPSKSLHVDDTVMYFHDPSFVMKLTGIKAQQLDFHRTFKGVGLYHTPEAPRQFQSWVQKVIDDWDFDNICCAHTEAKIGGARQALQRLLDSCASTFDKLVERNAKEQAKKGAVAHDVEDEDSADCGKYNVDGAECG